MLAFISLRFLSVYLVPSYFTSTCYRNSFIVTFNNVNLIFIFKITLCQVSGQLRTSELATLLYHNFSVFFCIQLICICSCNSNDSFKRFHYTQITFSLRFISVVFHTHFLFLFTDKRALQTCCYCVFAVCFHS